MFFFFLETYCKQMEVVFSKEHCKKPEGHKYVPIFMGGGVVPSKHSARRASKDAWFIYPLASSLLAHFILSNPFLGEGNKTIYPRPM